MPRKIVHVLFLLTKLTLWQEDVELVWAVDMMKEGQFFLASANKSLTLEAPTPTNISTKSEPEIEKNGTPASPAIAFANKVLPVPGGPSG